MEKLSCNAELEKKFIENLPLRFVRANIEVKQSPIHRYGVFAVNDINHREIIEECPALVFGRLILEYRESINDRVFYWDENSCALALGYGSMYNHGGAEPNAEYNIDTQNHCIRFIASKPIAAGTEILISYGDDWFSSRKPQQQPTYEEQKYHHSSLRFIVFILFLLILSVAFPIHKYGFSTHNKISTQHNPTTMSPIDKNV